MADHIRGPGKGPRLERERPKGPRRPRVFPPRDDPSTPRRLPRLAGQHGLLLNTCMWTRVSCDPRDFQFVSGCGHEVDFAEPVLRPDYKYCPYCGKRFSQKD